MKDSPLRMCLIWRMKGDGTGRSRDNWDTVHPLWRIPMEYSSKWGMDPSLRDKGTGLVSLVLPHVPAEHRLLPREAANPGHAEAAVRAEHGSGTVIHCGDTGPAHRGRGW